MVAVLFEALPSEGKWDEYLDIAAGLRPELSKIKGFISIERFQSITNPEKVLSLSFWKDEESIKQWRTIELHRTAQKKGRSLIFSDYRLRVASVQRDYGMMDREQAPGDSTVFHK
ncbi:heme-degrading monooxygenase HmoA [Algoriphagus sp. 4150]|uniref:antibiotic biosynthesis monooxygenase family protein n=1 Tax=Algoriphagus sp. 4150 TaxID=2817756 RepID=UPI0028647739|nr:antibiotic biosynthesis monooxygenase [Algoriphagus sp. 4150]MDR7131329.1 heme-degrading monooxygenase HmoA [Algoriphagus sp. 4150]